MGLHIDERVLQQVVNVLSSKSKSLYSLYATRRGMSPPVCGKGTVYKIKKLFDEGILKPYLVYLSQSEIVDQELEAIAGSKEIEEISPPAQPLVQPTGSVMNIGDLKIVPSAIGTKLVNIGPPGFFPNPPLPAYFDISIRLHVGNQSEVSITLSNIVYEVTINGNYAGTGSAPGAYTIPPHSEMDIDSPFKADFNTGEVLLLLLL